MVIFRNLPYLFMKSKAKVVVVGGGAVGVSMLYHLAKKGWSDVVLVERKELTSGSTWHAAGLLPLFNMSYSVGQLHKYAVNLYKTHYNKCNFTFISTWFFKILRRIRSRY